MILLIIFKNESLLSAEGLNQTRQTMIFILNNNINIWPGCSCFENLTRVSLLKTFNQGAPDWNVWPGCPCLWVCPTFPVRSSGSEQQCYHQRTQTLKRAPHHFSQCWTAVWSCLSSESDHIIIMKLHIWCCGSMIISFLQVWVLKLLLEPFLGITQLHIDIYDDKYIIVPKLFRPTRGFKSVSLCSQSHKYRSLTR